MFGGGVVTRGGVGGFDGGGGGAGGKKRALLSAVMRVSSSSAVGLLPIPKGTAVKGEEWVSSESEEGGRKVLREGRG